MKLGKTICSLLGFSARQTQFRSRSDRSNDRQPRNPCVERTHLSIFCCSGFRSVRGSERAARRGRLAGWLLGRSMAGWMAAWSVGRSVGLPAGRSLGSSVCSSVARLVVRLLRQMDRNCTIASSSPFTATLGGADAAADDEESEEDSLREPGWLPGRTSRVGNGAGSRSTTRTSVASTPTT